MSTILPGISIIVPCEGRVNLVEALLKSLQLARANYNGPSEVWIVDSSNSSDSEVLKRHCSVADANYAYGSPSVREKRNLGIEHAQYPIVLFTDSDCQAHPDLLVQHAESFLNSQDEPIGGIVGVTELVGPRKGLWNIIERTGFIDAFSNARRNEYVQWGTTSNISYKRDILEQVGRFETGFPFKLGGDDVDLGLKVTDRGYKLKCNPKAIVYHTRETWDSSWLFARRIWRWGRMHYYVFRRYPKRQFVILPRLFTIFILLLLAAGIHSITTGNPFFFLGIPLLWLALTLILSVLIYTRWSDKKFREAGTELSAALFSQVFEVGASLEGVVHADLRMLFNEISSSPPNREAFLKKNAEIWAMFITLISIIVVFW